MHVSGSEIVLVGFKKKLNAKSGISHLIYNISFCGNIQPFLYCGKYLFYNSNLDNEA